MNRLTTTRAGNIHKYVLTFHRRPFHGAYGVPVIWRGFSPVFISPLGFFHDEAASSPLISYLG